MGKTTKLASAFALALVLVLAAAPAAADDADDASARADALAAGGDLAGAVSALTAARDAYPQDYQLALGVARLESRRGGGERAIAAYRVAVARSPEAADAREELAFELARAKQSAWLALGASYGHVAFPGHAVKSTGDGVTLDASAALGGLTLWGTGRVTSFGTRDASVTSSFTQEEGYLSAGYGAATFGATLHAAVLHDGSGSLGTSLHGGASLRWSPAGDLVLALAASRYDDGDVFRAAPSYRVGLGAGFSLTPSVAVQRAEGKTYGSGSLTLAWDTPGLSFFAGAKYGEEVRPAYLDAHVVYAINEHVQWGLWGGARVRVNDTLSLRASYGFDQLATTTSSGTSQIHALSLGPVLTF
jgi:hypothetical protein